MVDQRTTAAMTDHFWHPLLHWSAGFVGGFIACGAIFLGWK